MRSYAEACGKAAKLSLSRLEQMRHFASCLVRIESYVFQRTGEEV